MQWLVGCVCLSLAACGGGDGPSGTAAVSESTVVTSNATFNVEQAVRNFLTVPNSYNLTSAVLKDALKIKFTVQAAKPATFEGRSVQRTRILLESTLNGQASDTDMQDLFFVATPFEFRGSSSTGDPDQLNYAVVTSSSALPVGVKVATTGPFYEAQFYQDNTKKTITGREVVTYGLFADTANTANLCLTTISKNTAGVTVTEERDCLRINPAGDVLGLTIGIALYDAQGKLLISDVYR